MGSLSKLLWLVLGFCLSVFCDELEVPELTIPVIDVSSLYWKSFPNFFMVNVIEEIGRACRDVGFFYITGLETQADQDSMDYKMLLAESLWFFSQPLEEKRKIDMLLGGSAWRGYFGVGDELTSGFPDQKEGIYFGSESNDTTKPLHGLNLYPTRPYLLEKADEPSVELNHILFQESVPRHMAAMKNIASRLMQAIALSLDLDPATALNFTQPTELFRIFSYPAHNDSFGAESQGVGEHTDYGYLTILTQDQQGGLQVRDAKTHEWVDVQPLHNHYVVNLGDALEHYTGGLYRATPHRVVQRVGASSPRLSMPYFFDPDFDSEMLSIADQLKPELREKILARRQNDEYASRRWDKVDPSRFSGRYGEYLLAKVSKVFPSLFARFVQATEEPAVKDEL